MAAGLYIFEEAIRFLYPQYDPSGQIRFIYDEHYKMRIGKKNFVGRQRKNTDFMSSGPCVLMVLEGKGVIPRVRNLMGATDPEKADSGTIRNDFASNIEQNIVHGSDSPESAEYEINYFFNQLEIF